MRSARLKVPADRPVGYYHCLSRVVNREFILHETEKDQFVSLMREYEDFCEVEVLRYWACRACRCRPAAALRV